MTNKKNSHKENRIEFSIVNRPIVAFNLYFVKFSYTNVHFLAKYNEIRWITIWIQRLNHLLYKMVCCFFVLNTT